MGTPVHVPLYIQEAAPWHLGGVDQDGAIATFGMPFARGKVQEVNGRPALAVTQSDVYQFRTLDKWADGTVRWALVDASADIVAGKATLNHAIVPGTGRSHPTDIARYVGDTIFVDTGPLQAVVPIDDLLFRQVVVDGLPIVDGPYARGLHGRTVSGQLIVPSSDTVVLIEENGPARALLFASGTLVTFGDGEEIIDFSLRITARAGSRDLEVTLTVRNANIERPLHNAIESLELAVRTDPGKARVVSVARHDGVEVAPFKDNAHLYQAYTTAHTWHTDSVDYVPHLPRLKGSLTEFVQEGYRLVVDGVPAHSLGDRKQWPRHGFLDLSGHKGGVTVAMKHMPHLWPAALEAHGGTVVAGVFTGRNPTPYTFVWRQHESRTAVFSFHTGPAVDPETVARRLDHPVSARAADYGHYDRSAAFAYRLLTVDDHNEAYALMGIDHQVTTSDKDLSICRYLGSHTTGGFNNMASIESQLLVQWLRHGLGGYYGRAMDLALWKSEWQVPRSDNFVHGLDPGASNPNRPHTMRIHGDQEHRYLEGIVLAYYLTGDRRFKDALFDEAEVLKDLYLYGQGRSMWQSIRAQAILAEFTKDTSLRQSLRHRVYYCSSQIIDIHQQSTGWGWEAAPDQGDRRYYVWGNDLHSEKPPGENFQTRGFFHASLGPIAWYHAARILAANDPMRILARGRMRDLSYWTRYELFPWVPNPKLRRLPYSYAVTLEEHTIPEKWDFHPILLGMAETYLDTKDSGYLRKGVEQIVAFAHHDEGPFSNNLYLLDVRPDCQHFMAIYREWAQTLP